jgi:hypothetical protein
MRELLHTRELKFCSTTEVVPVMRSPSPARAAQLPHIGISPEIVAADQDHGVAADIAY